MKKSIILFLSAAAPLLAAVLMASGFPAPPKMDAAPAGAAAPATAVLAGGCFWGMQAVFEHVRGVSSTEAGYSGGSSGSAHYEMVSDGKTGHAESVKLTYDPSKIAYGELLKVYFSAAHDPTTLNRQHHDEGTQYRSEIFYTSDEQKKMAEAYIRELNAAHTFRTPVVTRVSALKAFYPAEEYHQHFFDRNPANGYIANVDKPLLDGFRQMYPEYYRQ